MPEYGKGLQERSPPSTPMASLIRWLQVKKYQYEVTFSLYMLTPAEKCIFNIILLTLTSLLLTAAVFYLPNHVMIISNRIWYYIHGEFYAPLPTLSAALGDGPLGSVVAADAKEALTSATTATASLLIGKEL
ncbi:hypothetical protein DV736_g3251, partial [Chaetothyriales sp. CBS 134916]